MFKIRKNDSISEKGLKLLPEDIEVSIDERNPDGIILRSHKLSEEEFGVNLVAVARAGAGVNNIPVDRCTELGIVVFNTPGANANAVKELVVAGMLMSSRKIYESIKALHDLEDKTDLGKKAEKIKKQFAGPEISGKTLGIIGLGAIGALVAQAAVGMDMKVIGYDPFITIENAWKIPKEVEYTQNELAMLPHADYLSVHIPVNDKTRQMINKDFIGRMKKGSRLLNFSRGELVNILDVKAALQEGQLAYYVTDFSSKELLGTKNCLCLPHLGASTPEAEENCAVLACRQLDDYLRTGNIRNSVNYPDMQADTCRYHRIAVFHKNIPGMIGKISDEFGAAGINIEDMQDKSRGDFAYYLLDINKPASEELAQKIRNTEGVIRVRSII